MAASGYKVAVVCASGVTGEEVLRILEERNFPVREVVALAGAEAPCTAEVEFLGEVLPLRALEAQAFTGVELALFAGDGRTSAEYVPVARAAGCTVIDTSACFRLQPEVPLIVPEVNAARIGEHQGIVAVPGSSTIQLVVPLAPVHRRAQIRRLIVSTYQAVSENGARAMDELTEQIRELFSFRDPTVDVYPHQIAFNALPHVGDLLENGFTSEEMMLASEVCKILEDDSIGVCATMVRIPVFYGHSENVHVETQHAITPDEVRELLRASPGVRVEDDPAHDIYPLSLFAAGRDECFVGRIRADLGTDRGIMMWIVADNTRRGCALTAVQVAELLISG